MITTPLLSKSPATKSPLVSPSKAVEKSELAGCLRDLQKGMLTQMLNLEPGAVWKVLILDEHGKRIVSPLFRVSELKELGVTLTLDWHAARTSIPDVPAVYFGLANPQNMERLAQDMHGKMYERFHVNFCDSIARPQMESFAQRLVELAGEEGAVAGRLARMVDQCMDFSCLEDDLFTVEHPKAFSLVHGNKATESQLTALFEQCAQSLFGAVVSMGGPMPLLVTRRGDASGEAVVGIVAAKLKSFALSEGGGDSLGPRQMAFQDALGLQRPVVIVLDRSFDLQHAVKHSSAYNALCHDVFGMRLNRMHLTSSTSTSSSNTTTTDMVVDGEDWFWRQNSALSFPLVTEHIDAALAQYKRDKEQLDPTNLSDASPDRDVTSEQLKRAMRVVPELTERKRIIDTHLQVCSALLEAIKARDLGDLVSLYRGSELRKQGVLEAFAKGQGDAMDKLRLYMFFLVQSLLKPSSSTDLAEVEVALRAAKGPVPTPDQVGAVARFVRSLVKASSTTMLTSPTTTTASSTTTTTTLHATNVNAQLLQRIGEQAGGISQLWGSLVSSVKGLIPESTSDTPLCRQLDSCLDWLASPANYNIGSGGDNKWSLLDPLLRAKDPHPPHPNHVVVFVVGGVSYSEVNNLREHMARKHTAGAVVSAHSPTDMHLTVGSTELLRGSSLLQQILDLAS